MENNSCIVRADRLLPAYEVADDSIEPSHAVFFNHIPIIQGRYLAVKRIKVFEPIAQTPKLDEMSARFIDIP